MLFLVKQFNSNLKIVVIINEMLLVTERTAIIIENSEIFLEVVLRIAFKK